MVNSVSQSLIKYSPLLQPMAMVRDHIIHRMDTAFEQGVTVVANILKGYPEFAPYAFDVAMCMEEKGNKQAADKIRKIAVEVIRVSSPSPSINDPHFLTPPLTGKYPVGVKSFYVEDLNRNEKDLGHNTNRTRRLELNVHYPAIQNKEPAYKIDPNVEEIAFPNPLKKEKFDNLWTRSQPGLKPSTEEKFPIIIFSHGWGQNHNDYQQIVEELASHGYCVISVNHPFSNFVTAHVGHYQDLRQLDEFGTLDEVHQKQKIANEVMTNAKDIEFVIHQIKSGKIEDFESLLGESVNSELIGVLGHSMGGAAALQTCKDVPSVKAGINLDGRIFQSSEEKENVVAQPFLIVSAGGASIDPVIKEVREGWDELQRKNPSSSRVDIPHATHGDFTIVPLYVEREAEKANESYAEITRATNKEILGFFNQHFK